MGTLALMLLGLCFSCKEEQPKDKSETVLSYVDPFIGTGGHGHTFPGAVAPFGMVQPSPDNGRGGWDWCSGYHITDSLITGFAQLHLSGTGIGDLADLLLMPTTKAVDLEFFGRSRDSLPYVSQFTHDDETASPGYYSVLLKDSKVKVELTANEYIALHKYTYPTGVEPSFIMDLGYAVNWDKPLESHISLENEKLVVGYRHSVGWAKNQKLFFAIESSEPLSIKKLVSDSKVTEESDSISGVQTGAQFFLNPNTSEVELKIAVSSVSVENAKENLNAKGKGTFEKTRADTEKKWESVLSKIKVETPVDSLKTIFYTALYHTHVAPSLFSDVNGELRLQNDSIVQTSNGSAYSTLSLWDTFRAENPLLNILQPEVSNDIVVPC